MHVVTFIPFIFTNACTLIENTFTTYIKITMLKVCDEFHTPHGPVRSRYTYTETYSHTTGYAQQNILQVVIARGTLTTPDDDR
jgi:hypothetical protein